ncbi:MAG: methyl-accepting chemotaxis protein [Gammaproteobacteria bacterium]|nr:methyl-accepting chemotaxis protein [Gammaproteobacteria bacterium]
MQYRDEFQGLHEPSTQESNKKGQILLFCLLVGVVSGIAFAILAQFFVELTATSQTWFVGSCIVAGVFWGFINYYIFTHWFSKNLQHIAEVIDSLGRGDFSARCKIVRHDIGGRIALSVNAMSTNLSSSILQISESTGKISNAISELKQFSYKTSESIERQQTETDQAATAMTEMTATVQEVARNAEQAAIAARDADIAAKDGSKLASQAMGGIEELNGEVDKAGNVIQKLEQDSQSIGVVLEVIQGIAEQTNLLALNAAIEAARAGEQGRGFAVVADEVRTLASRTQQSTEEIKKMIEQLQSGAGAAVRVMDQAREKAQIGEKSVEKAVETLSTIGGAVSTIDEMNTQIASAAQEQGSVAEEINKNIASINLVAEEAVHGADLTENASQEIVALVEELTSVVKVFRH